MPVFPAHGNAFLTPRFFWEAREGYGLAQVTSRSFPTQLNNFHRNSDGSYAPSASYEYPRPVDPHYVVLSDLDPHPIDLKSTFLATQCGSDLRGCKLKMIGARVLEPFASDETINDRASTDSIFDEDLQLYGRSFSAKLTTTGVDLYRNAYAAPAINRFNVDRAYQYLIPKALAYTTGFLNFYFRGKMSINPPKGGAYAIVDESPFSPSNPTDVAAGFRGFPTVRVALANTTSLNDDGTRIEGAVDQPMTDGKLWLVLRYHRNKCFTDDFSTMATDMVVLDGCIDPTEEIVASNPIDRTGKGIQVLPMPTADAPLGEELKFELTRELPINAWNVLLQVVFRGTLGQEENKIAVSTIDISEPTFLSIQNNTDYVYLRGRCYKPQEIRADPSLWNLVTSICKNAAHPEDIMSAACYNAKLGFRLDDASSDAPRFSISNAYTADSDQRIPPARFARFAALTDKDKGFKLHVYLQQPEFSSYLKLVDMDVVPYRAHLSRTTPGEQNHDIFVPERSIRTWDSVAIMFDAETGVSSKDADTDCIGGLEDSLSPLQGDDRFPFPTNVKWVSN